MAPHRYLENFLFAISLFCFCPVVCQKIIYPTVAEIEAALLQSALSLSHQYTSQVNLGSSYDYNNCSFIDSYKLYESHPDWALRWDYSSIYYPHKLSPLLQNPHQLPNYYNFLPVSSTLFMFCFQILMPVKTSL